MVKQAHHQPVGDANQITMRGTSLVVWWVKTQRSTIKLVTNAPPLVSKHYLSAELNRGPQNSLCSRQTGLRPTDPLQILPATPLQTALRDQCQERDHNLNRLSTYLRGHHDYSTMSYMPDCQQRRPKNSQVVPNPTSMWQCTGPKI